MAARTLIPLVFLAVLPAQGAPAPQAKKWTQEELTRVSDEIRAEIETLRGMKFKRPVKVEVADKKRFIEYARQRQEKTETPERRRRDELQAKMLGLIPPDMDLQAAIEKLLEEQVGGFYDPGSDTFYLMESFGGDLARIILSHELTHALDDQHFDLDAQIRRLGQRTDAEFAYQALVEGSGTSAMNQWTVQHMESLDRDALLGSADIGTKGLEEAPPYLWKPLIAAYLRGEGFLVKVAGMNVAMKAAATEDVRRAFGTPPRSSEQILHPEKYWDPESLDEPRSVTIDTAGLPEGWKVTGEDTLGEIYLALVTTPEAQRKPFNPKNPLAVLGIEYTNKAAEGWGGDRAVLLEKGEARVLWLVSAWDTPEDAAQFREAAVEVFGTASGGDEPGSKVAFRHRVDRIGESDVVTVVASTGVDEKDLPRPKWNVEAASGVRTSRDPRR